MEKGTQQCSDERAQGRINKKNWNDLRRAQGLPTVNVDHRTFLCNLGQQIEQDFVDHYNTIRRTYITMCQIPPSEVYDPSVYSGPATLKYLLKINGVHCTFHTRNVASSLRVLPRALKIRVREEQIRRMEVQLELDIKEFVEHLKVSQRLRNSLAIDGGIYLYNSDELFNVSAS